MTLYSGNSEFSSLPCSVHLLLLDSVEHPKSRFYSLHHSHEMKLRWVVEAETKLASKRQCWEVNKILAFWTLTQDEHIIGISYSAYLSNYYFSWAWRLQFWGIHSWILYMGEQKWPGSFSFHEINLRVFGQSLLRKHESECVVVRVYRVVCIHGRCVPWLFEFLVF